MFRSPPVFWCMRYAGSKTGRGRIPVETGITNFLFMKNNGYIRERRWRSGVTMAEHSDAKYKKRPFTDIESQAQRLNAEYRSIDLKLSILFKISRRGITRPINYPLWIEIKILSNRPCFRLLKINMILNRRFCGFFSLTCAEEPSSFYSK